MIKNINSRQQLIRQINKLKTDDIIIVPNLIEVSRSMTELLTMIDQIEEKGAYIKSKEDIWLDTTTDNPNRKFLLTILNGMAKYERERLSIRIKEGIEDAKEKGSILGRPKKSNKKIELAIRLKEEGKTVKEIEELTGVSRATLYRRLKSGDQS